MAKKMGFFITRTADAGELKGILPIVDIAAALVIRDEKILTVYNAKWGAFTIPSTKRRSWEGAGDAPAREEAWEDAAARAAGEALGRTTTAEPEFLADLPEFQQSDRDGQWKRYRLKAYQLADPMSTDTASAQPVEWLTADEILDPARRPISPTARHIVRELQLKGII